MVDQDGYRSNVAMVISNGRGQVFWAKRMGQKAWQFPQGGIDQGETAEQALYRELYEEVGLEPGDVKIIQQTRRWLRYDIPEKMQRKHSKPRCIGQKQRWFFLQLVGDQKKLVSMLQGILNLMLGSGLVIGIQLIRWFHLSKMFIVKL